MAVVSPKGRSIEVVTGNPGDIDARGAAIKALGQHMLTSADTLEGLATGADCQAGESIEKLRESVGEVYLELRLAGKRYKPSGEALIAYARALDDVKTRMNVTVPGCVSAWNIYQTKQAASAQKDQTAHSVRNRLELDYLGPDFLNNRDQLEAAAEAAEAAAGAAAAVASEAHNDFISLANTFDGQYDDWSVAFDTAASALEDATDGGVSDGPGDYFNRALDIALVVLQYAGMVLAVLAFVVGGPILVALAAIVAIVTLVVTIVAMARKRADGVDLAFAIIGVIPFGSLAKFGGGFKAGALGMLDDMVGGLGTAAGRGAFKTAVVNFKSTFETARVFGQGWAGAGGTALRGSSTMDDLAARIGGFADARELAAAGTNDWSIAGQVFGHWGWMVNTPISIVHSSSLAISDLIGGVRDGLSIDGWERQFAGG